MFPLLWYEWHRHFSFLHSFNMRPSIYWLCNMGHITFGCWRQYIMFPGLFIECLDVTEWNPSGLTESSDRCVWRLLTAPKPLKHYAWTTDRHHNVPQCPGCVPPRWNSHAVPASSPVYHPSCNSSADVLPAHLTFLQRPQIGQCMARHWDPGTAGRRRKRPRQCADNLTAKTWSDNIGWCRKYTNDCAIV